MLQEIIPADESSGFVSNDLFWSIFIQKCSNENSVGGGLVYKCSFIESSAKYLKNSGIVSIPLK